MTPQMAAGHRAIRELRAQADRRRPHPPGPDQPGAGLAHLRAVLHRLTHS